MRLTVAEVAAAFELPVPGRAGGGLATGAAIDSRKVKKGDLFFCLLGEHVDGHDFAGRAEQNGCCAIVAQRPLPGAHVPVFAVPDPALALARLAGMWRQKSAAKVLCLTGTAGKTTLKETLKAILGQSLAVAATEGNQNNQLGLPLTILNTTGREDLWILELGISHAGDMDFLGAIARPDIALILNVGPGHTEGLGQKGVAWHKARLLKYLTGEGIGLVNADYPDLVSAAMETGKRAQYFGCQAGGAISLPFRLLASSQDGCQSVRLPCGDFCFKTPFIGTYGGEIAVAAAAAASLAGATPEQIARGFGDVSLPRQRFRQIELGSVLIFDDTYNANPLSMERMLAAARQKAGERPFYALLGAMGELGSGAVGCHEGLGRQLAVLRPAAIFWHGDFGDSVREGLAGAAPLWPVATPEDFLALWQRHAPVGNEFVFLFKGSRANHLEDYLSLFCDLLKGKGEQKHVL